MEVQIISRETIKPFSPTPDHLRTHKHSLLDQLVPPIYLPMILFYSATDKNDPRNYNISDYLKKSLSKALTHFYPFAGRIKDDLTVDCNDGGVTFVEAQVACDMSLVLEEPEIEVQQLLPCAPFEHSPPTLSSTDQVTPLAVQVNYFACGGMAISVCISHVIADASAAAHFLNGWAAVARGADNIEGVIYDSSSLFPPRDLSMFRKHVGRLVDENKKVESPEDKFVTKRLLFNGSKITALRNEIGDGLNLYRPTRVEAVTAVVWEALINATAENDGRGTSPILAVSNAMNLRKRMNPPLPQQCIGNVSFSKLVSSLNVKIKNRSNLAKIVHESIKETDDEYIRKTFTRGECLNLMEKICEKFEKNSKVGMFMFSCWCRFPFYEVDFGWGKPTWFECPLRANRVGFFVDTSDGEGIEAWITLRKEEMAKLEKEPGILAYATFKPSI
ncbi:vinorine synthase-like [Herrania umbratica]|uniref:Vinorine synthase-like n=1 Tax=Herrania umbratica TaxID=108875 RepID=A0A6J1A835_9ROSI|nr:vinorine synthase-like [Herrania umbratica]